MKRGRFTDSELLREAREKVLLAQRSGTGIGTQKEKSVHWTLKYLLEPDEHFHEQSVGHFVADVKNEERIYEIQTGNSYPLIKKLRAYRDVCPVTVVKPVFVKNTVRWLEPDTYAMEEKPGRGKQERLTGILSDMKNLIEFLPDPRFSVLVLLMESEEYRLQDGYGEKRKTRATKVDKVPVRITDDYLFEAPADWAALFPKEITGPFTVPELAKALRISDFHAYRAVKVFELSGCIQEAGKRGRAALYEPAAERS